MEEEENCPNGIDFNPDTINLFFFHPLSSIFLARKWIFSLPPLAKIIKRGK